MGPGQLPSEAEVEANLWEENNWGRWGADDELGAINLITAEKRRQALGLVRTGETVSLSRPLATTPGPNNPRPSQHYVRWMDRGAGWGAAFDYYGMDYHGHTTTHIDALCHIWGPQGLYNRRAPEETLTPLGARANAISAWSGGIVTRGVLLDVPRQRGSAYVGVDEPVHGDELAAIAAAQGVELSVGDALVVYSGREAYMEAHPDRIPGVPPLPGLHASCLPFIRDQDVAMLVWDLMDMKPSGYAFEWGVHGVIPAYGVALVDNALLAPLAEACAREGRYEFLLMVLPLVVKGGTGSPVNPVAML